MTYLPHPERYQSMQYRRCGRSGLQLPAVSLGLWHNFGHVDVLENCRKILRLAFDRGITHFDLANNYGPPPGSAEENFGRLLRQDFGSYRDQLIISTKAGYLMWEGPYGEWGSKKYLVASLDQSLQRMGLEYVDIFYHHRPDPDTPLEETMAKGGLQFINPGSEILICLQRLAQSTTLSGVQAFLRLLQLLADHSARKAMTRKWFNKHYYVQDDAKIRRVLDHVHAHLKEITFGQAATYTGLSNSSFARFFKTKTDRTFSEYVNEARIKHAQDLLIGTAQPIREVSQACGFDNLSYFNRVFKKLNQRTPAEYRNHFR